jgi:hypothetical protein
MQLTMSGYFRKRLKHLTVVFCPNPPPVTAGCGPGTDNSTCSQTSTPTVGCGSNTDNSTCNPSQPSKIYPDGIQLDLNDNCVSLHYPVATGCGPGNSTFNQATSTTQTCPGDSQLDSNDNCPNNGGNG